MRPGADDPTAPEPPAASLRVARLAGPCPWGMVVLKVLWLLSQGLYLGSSLPSPCNLPRTRAFSFILHVYVCVVCMYVLMFICVWTQKSQRLTSPVFLHYSC